MLVCLRNCGSCNAGSRQHHRTPICPSTAAAWVRALDTHQHACLPACLPHNSTCWGRQGQLLAAAATEPPRPDTVAPRTTAVACTLRCARGCYNTWLLEIQRPCAAAGCNRSAVLHHCCALALEALLLGNCHKAVHLLLQGTHGNSSSGGRGRQQQAARHT